MLERDRKLLEAQVKDLQVGNSNILRLLQVFFFKFYWRVIGCYTNINDVHGQARLDDAEQNALKGGKKAISKMDSRIR
jgi:hypothetical protein